MQEGVAQVIRLTRLNNQVLVVNSDLVKYVESAPDTVLTLITGEKILVRETADQVVERIVEFRRRILEGFPVMGVDPSTASSILNRHQSEQEASPESEERG
jgi:flagellar protein FlbD